MTVRSPIPLTRRLRLLVSIFLVVHLLAVVLPPLSFQARGPLGVSPAVATALSPVDGYAQALYMDRGYAFFAPDPGPSHLIQALITSPDAAQTERMYPALDDQWPRLLYHRHFMLAEFLTEIYHPPGPPAGLAAIDPVEAENWVRARARYEHVRQSMVEHLRGEYPGQDVAIRRIEHLIPDLSLDPMTLPALDDPQSYRVLLDRPIDFLDEGTDQSGTNRRTGELVAPSRPPESVPPPRADVGSEFGERDTSIPPSAEAAP